MSEAKFGGEDWLKDHLSLGRELPFASVHEWLAKDDLDGDFEDLKYDSYHLYELGWRTLGEALNFLMANYKDIIASNLDFSIWISLPDTPYVLDETSAALEIPDVHSDPPSIGFSTRGTKLPVVEALAKKVYASSIFPKHYADLPLDFTYSVSAFGSTFQPGFFISVRRPEEQPLRYAPTPAQLASLTGDRKNPLELWLVSARFKDEMKADGESDLYWDNYVTQGEIEAFLRGAAETIKRVQEAHEVRIYTLNSTRARRFGIGRRKLFEPDLWFYCKKSSASIEEEVAYEGGVGQNTRQWLLRTRIVRREGIRQDTHTFLNNRAMVRDVVVTMLDVEKAPRTLNGKQKTPITEL